MIKAKHWVDVSLSYLLSTLMAAMVVVITWQVISRYLLQAPSTWTEEVARYLLIWIGMFGSAYVFSIKMHLGIDLLVNRLTGSSATAVHIGSQLVCSGFALSAMVIGGSNLVGLTWELNQTSPALGIKIAWVYSAIPLAGGLICFYSLLFMLTPVSSSTASE